MNSHHHQPLGAYLDGEVSGLERLRVASHLESCEACATDATDWREVGDLLRARAAAEPVPAGLEGLAGGVVSRIRAERAQSWRALFARAFDDWHWFAVAGGSVAAAFASTLIVTLLLQFGPTPQRDDSLAALLTNLESPAGTLFLLGTQGPSGKAQPVFLQFDDGSNAHAVVPVSLYGRDALDRESLVTKLSDTLSSRGVLDSRSMHPKDRLAVEGLLDKLNGSRFNDNARPAAPVTITQFLLFTNVGVSAKGI